MMPSVSAHLHKSLITAIARLAWMGVTFSRSIHSLTSARVIAFGSLAPNSGMM
jgi:hypothetical protein